MTPLTARSPELSDRFRTPPSHATSSNLDLFIRINRPHKPPSIDFSPILCSTTPLAPLCFGAISSHPPPPPAYTEENDAIISSSSALRPGRGCLCARRPCESRARRGHTRRTGRVANHRDRPRPRRCRQKRPIRPGCAPLRPPPQRSPSGQTRQS